MALVFAVFFQLFNSLSAREGFKKGTDLLVTDINDILNDVATGSYYDVEGVHCDQVGNPPAIQYHVDADALPGHHDACVFLGKAIQLGEAGKVSSLKVDSSSTVGKDQDNLYNVFTLVGLTSDRIEAGDISTVNQYHFFVFRNEGSKPEFDSSEYRHVKEATIISAYVWNDDDNNSVVDLSTEVTYIDGIAVLLNSFGAQRSQNERAFLGASRNIGIHVSYLTASKTNPDRLRPDRATYIERSEANKDSVASRYYHPLEGGQVIVCLQGGGGKSFVRIGSINGVLAAEAELDEAELEDKCPTV